MSLTGLSHSSTSFPVGRASVAEKIGHEIDGVECIEHGTFWACSIDDLPPLSPPDASSPSPDAPVAWAGSVEWDESWMEHDLAASQPPTESISAPVPASTPAHSVSRKCSDDSVLHSVKQAKVTPAECISNAVMHFSGVFGDSMFKLVSQLDPSLMQHRTAMATAHEKETWLSLQNKVKLGNILKETKEADAYMSWVEASSPE
ncbi:hypothetical protein Moror_11799 [Moniliophthora roreri MCA 2997]|uniref:Uncharacterized protein n=1 Tax=Moniliophthora roreri (strain MCA 2997) TaxID=1381753 RepID=V2W821_MONRO|nr:hypothetical protein Moror_11799 [Moniliophthora roreri MCA 2997]